MRKIWVLTVLTLTAVSVALGMPRIVLAALPNVAVTKLEYKQYQEHITVVGKLEATEKSDIQVDLPVVAKAVNVSMGDKVKVGDVLAEVDLDKTKQAVLAMINSYQSIPPAILSLLSAVDMNQEKLLTMIPKTIVADYSGVVSDLNLTVGAMATPTETIATIAKPGQLRAVLRVPEEYGSKIEKGQLVSMQVPALRDQVFTGQINYISATAYETLMGTSKQVVSNVYVKFDEQSELLKSGYTVTAVIALGDEEEIATLPYEAIDQDDGGVEHVYLYTNGRAVKRVVITGRELQHGVEIVSGIAPYELVITQNSAIKKERQFVKIDQ